MWARSFGHTFLLLLLSLLLQSPGQRALAASSAAAHVPPPSCLSGLQLQVQVPGRLELLQGVSLERGKAAAGGGFAGRNGRVVGGGGGGGGGQGIKKSVVGGGEEGGRMLRGSHLLPVCMEQAPAAYYGQLMLFFCATISSMLVFIYYTAPAQLRTQISRQQPPRSRKGGRAGASLIVWRSKHGSVQAQVQVVNGGAGGGGGDGKWVFPWVGLSRLFASSSKSASVSSSSSSTVSCSGVGSSEEQAPGSKTEAQERPRPGSGSGRKGSWKGAGRGSDRQGRQASRSSSEPGGGGSPTPASSTSGRQAGGGGGAGGGSVKQPKESFRKGGQSKKGFLGRSSVQEQEQEQEQLLVDAGIDAHKDKQRKAAQSRSLRVEGSAEVGSTPSPHLHKQESGSTGAESSTSGSSSSSRGRASKSDSSSPSSESPKSSSSSSAGWAEWEGWGKATVQGGATGWWNRSGIWGPQDLNSTSSATAAFGRAVAFGSQGHWTPPDPLWGDGHCSLQPWLLRDSLVTSFLDLGTSVAQELDCEAAASDFPNSVVIQDVDKLLLKCRARPSSVEGDTDWSSSLPSSPGCFSPFSSPRAVGSRRVVGVIGQGLNGSNGGNPSEQVPVPIQYCPLLAPYCPLPIPKVSCSLWSDDSLFAP